MSCFLAFILACVSRIGQVDANAHEAGNTQQGGPGPSPPPLSAHRVVRAMEEHAEDQAERTAKRDGAPCILCQGGMPGGNKNDIDARPENDRNQEQVAGKAHAEELCCEG